LVGHKFDFFLCHELITLVLWSDRYQLVLTYRYIVIFEHFVIGLGGSTFFMYSLFELKHVSSTDVDFWVI